LNVERGEGARADVETVERRREEQKNAQLIRFRNRRKEKEKYFVTM